MTTPILGLDEISENQASKYITHNTALRDLELATIVKIASVSAGMQTGDGKTDLYTVPTSYKFIPTHVVVRNPSASLAGGTDFDFGDGANADTWKNTVDLSSLTATTDCIVITFDSKFTIYDAADVFGIMPVTGASASGATATIEVFGYLFAA